MLNKILSDKVNGTKNAVILLSRVPTHQVLFLICDSYIC